MDNDQELTDKIFKTALAAHPDASPLPDCVNSSERRVGVVVALDMIALHMQDALEATRTPAVEVHVDGYYTLAGGDVVNTVNDSSMDDYLGDRENGRRVWEWIYNLAIKGHAPHILPGMILEPKDELLHVKRDPNDTGNSRNLWKLDCKNAQALYAYEQKHLNNLETARLVKIDADAQMTRQMLGAPAIKFKLGK